VQYGSAGATPTLTVRSRPYPLKVIAQMSDISGAQQIIVRQSVNSLDELRGKKIGVMRGTASEALFASVVRDYKFDPGSAELINMDPTDMTTAFVRGDVDAIVLWEPQATKARKLVKGKILVSATRSYFGGKAVDKRVYGDHAVLFATEATLKDQPAVARSVVTALLKANDFIRTNRGEAVAILAKAYGLEPEEMSAILDVNVYTLQLDEQLVSDMTKLSAFLLENKRIKQPVQVREMFDTAILKSVQPDLVKM
jgi:sulfonate transport system substrate-binding protein